MPRTGKRYQARISDDIRQRIAHLMGLDPELEVLVVARRFGINSSTASQIMKKILASRETKTQTLPAR